MRVLASESYNVAWFKLADFIAKGEKERALSIHRLLMHSVQDVAIAYQLEGDILLAFDDDAALDRYHVAANLYKKAGKMKQAISVYEHVSLFKEDETIYEALLDIYRVIQNKSAILDTFSKLAKICLQRNNMMLLSQLFQKYLEDSSKHMQACLSARYVRALFLHDEKHASITIYTYQTLDLFRESLVMIASCTVGYDVEIRNSDDKDLQKFLSDLKALDIAEYIRAIDYIKKYY